MSEIKNSIRNTIDNAIQDVLYEQSMAIDNVMRAFSEVHSQARNYSFDKHHTLHSLKNAIAELGHLQEEIDHNYTSLWEE